MTPGASPYPDQAKALQSEDLDYNPLCSSSDPELWFPAKGERGIAAKAICRSCALQRPCLDFALRTQQLHGVWGGTNPGDRIKILRRAGALP